MWRRASVVRVVDIDARARRRAQVRGDVGELVVGVLWGLFGWRVELLGLAVILAVEQLLAGVVGEVASVLLVAAALGAALTPPAMRHRVLRLLYAMRVRRVWARAAIDAGVASAAFRCPVVRSVERVVAGDRLRVRVRRGQSVSDLAARREQLAACLRVRERPWFATRVMRPRPKCCWCAAIRSRTPSRCAGRRPRPGRCRCGSRSRWASTSTARRSRSGWWSATCWWAGSRGRASRSRCRCWWPPRCSTRARGCGCWTASWSSWPAGRRWPNAWSAPTARRRSSCCGSCRR